MAVQEQRDDQRQGCEEHGGAPEHGQCAGGCSRVPDAPRGELWPLMAHRAGLPEIRCCLAWAGRDWPGLLDLSDTSMCVGAMQLPSQDSVGRNGEKSVRIAFCILPHERQSLRRSAELPEHPRITPPFVTAYAGTAAMLWTPNVEHGSTCMQAAREGSGSIIPRQRAVCTGLPRQAAHGSLQHFRVRPATQPCPLAESTSQTRQDSTSVPASEAD